MPWERWFLSCWIVIWPAVVSLMARRVEVVSALGISALQAAAARSGALLGHDFCTISLSDLLTPWDAIERRIHAAGAGDFVIAFYNPVSKRRRTQLASARDTLLTYRDGATPVLLASNLGRPEERLLFLTLATLDVDEVDMLTVVMVGASTSRQLTHGRGCRSIRRAVMQSIWTRAQQTAHKRRPAHDRLFHRCRAG